MLRFLLVTHALVESLALPAAREHGGALADAVGHVARDLVQGPAVDQGTHRAAVVEPVRTNLLNKS